MSYSLLLAYIGPETMLPLASFIAGLVGALLVGWRYVLALFSRIVSRIFGRGKDADVLASPSSPEIPE